MSAPWRPEEYTDTYTEQIRELVEAKRAGSEVTPAEAAPQATDVSDLLAALQASIEARKAS